MATCISLRILCASALLTVVACDHHGVDRDDWGDYDDGDGDGHEAAQPGSPGVNVIARAHGVDVAGLDILVHDAAGTLISRHVTGTSGVYVPADPGDSVSVVWHDPEASEGQGWVLDSARVTAETIFRPRTVFHVKAPALPFEPNAPVHVAIETASSPFVTQTYVALSCAAPVLVTGGVAVFDDYQGCAGQPESAAAAVGLDAQGRIVAFDSISFGHEQAVQLQLAMTPVAAVTPVYTATWTTSDVEWISGAADWQLGDWTLLDPEPLLASDPLPGLQFQPYLPLTKAGASLVTLAARVQAGDGLCHDLTFTAASYAETWDLERLALPWFDAATSTWSIGTGGDPGDAVVIDLPYGAHRYRWVEPPSTPGAVLELIVPELPDDLAIHFPSGELGEWQIRNEDRAEPATYAEYLKDGAGEFDPRFVRESSNAGPCAQISE